MKSTKKSLILDKEKDKAIFVDMVIIEIDGERRINTNFHMLNLNVLELAFLYHELGVKVAEQMNVTRRNKNES